MSDDEQGGKSFNWGGLVKGILAGAAVVAGIELIAPGTVSGIISSLSTTPGSTVGLKSLIEGIGPTLRIIAGAAMSLTGLSYLLSDSSQNENAERHAQTHHEAKESFAIREDMRKMQTVMMARMKASGHEPAMAMAAQQGR